MKKILMAAGYVCLFGFGSLPAFAETPPAAPAAEYSSLISKRQVVDQLLAEAWQVFKSPARISTAGFTAKMPSNMEIVTERLLQAYRLEPYRTDLLISAANAQIYNSNVDKAIALFQQALAQAPDDLDLNSYLYIWQSFKGNEAEARQHLKLLGQRNPARAADMQRIRELVGRMLATPLNDQAKVMPAGRQAIVTLGYALNPDGSMHDILVKRLEQTLAQARLNPQAMIIVTGGVPQNRQTEGRLMADWLVAQGLARERIIEENYATSTVDNALFSSYALARLRSSQITMISSASHVRRGQALLEIASWQTGPAAARFESLAYADKPLAELKLASSGEIMGIYRDALRTYGLWSYRSAPLLER